MTEIKKFRNLKNRNIRIQVMKYNGNNVDDIREFLGVPVMESKDKTYIKINFENVYINQYVGKRIFDISEKPVTGLDIIIENRKSLKKNYRKIEWTKKHKNM